MKRLLVLFLLVSISSFWIACSTDVELNAPYKSTPVVFGLLDPVADTQWIKINKTFLGNGDNMSYAQIRDSSEYPFEDFETIEVQEVQNGSVINTYSLSEITIHNKEVNGIFYAPEQTVYYFKTPLVGGQPKLNEESQYKLFVRFTDGKVLSATTNLVKTTQISFIQPQPTSTISMATNTGGNSVNYVNSVNVKWTAAENVVLYDFTLRFHFSEELNGLTEAKTLDYKLGQYKINNPLLGQTLTLQFNGESFFSFVGRSLDYVEGMQRPIGYYDAVAQKTRCFDMRMAIGNDELNTYYEVNRPVTGVIQERPTYTNILMSNGSTSENGIGLFASRSYFNLENIALTASGAGGAPQIGNLVAFKYGEYTNDLNFCDPNPTNGVYSCN